jgi:quercetin dioxygenase-like cupin family protein
MPSKGQILINTESGDQYEFIETAQDTKGSRVTVKATVKSKGKLVPNHFHVSQDETFEILSGCLTLWLEGEEKTIKPGEQFTLPKGIPHNHYNNSDEEVVYLHRVEPAMDFDYFLENLVGLASDGKSKGGSFGLVQELVTLRYLEGKTYLADMPLGIQKLLMQIVGPIGRLLGYRAVYKKYTGQEK